MKKNVMYLKAQSQIVIFKIQQKVQQQKNCLQRCNLSPS